MKILQRPSVADRVADWLRQQLAAGSPGSEIPSCRQLAARLEVSPPTVMQALGKLVDEGWLVAGKPRRPYRIAQTGRAERAVRQTLLLLSPQPLAACNSYTRTMVERILVKCAADGLDVQPKVLDYRNRRYPARKWEELIRSHHPTRMMVVTGTPMVARWASGLEVPTLFLGGSPGETSISTVGVSLSASLRVLLRNLPDDQCLHFCLPICGNPAEFATAIHRVCREELESRGMPFVPGYHSPFRVEGGAAAVRAAVTPALLRHRPRLFVFIAFADYLAVQGLLFEQYQSAGFLPRLAFLSHDEMIDLLDPAPARFIYPHAKLWRLVKSWLANPAGKRFNRGFILLDAIFRPGTGGRQERGRAAADGPQTAPSGQPPPA